MNSEIDAIVDTFPIAEFAKTMKMNPEAVRVIAYNAVRNAIINNGYPKNVGKVMQYTITAAKHKK